MDIKLGKELAKIFEMDGEIYKKAGYEDFAREVKGYRKDIEAGWIESDLKEPLSFSAQAVADMKPGKNGYPEVKFFALPATPGVIKDARKLMLNISTPMMPVTVDTLAGWSIEAVK